MTGVQTCALPISCGTPGEGATLTPRERADVIRTCVEAARGRCTIIAGAGSNSTAEAVEGVKLARELGADAALVVVPFYNKPDARMQLAHFRAVAEEGGLPVVVYNVPGRTGANMDADTFLRLAEHPGIVAVKEASANLTRSRGSAARCRTASRCCPATTPGPCR